MRKSTKNKEAKLKAILDEIHQTINLGGYEKAQELLDTVKIALDEAEIENELRVDYLAELGKLHYRKGDYEQAEKYLEEARRKGTEYPKSLAYALNYLGVLEWARGNLDQAEIYHSETLRLRTQIKYVVGVGGSLCNLGLLYLTKGEPKKAIDHLCKAIDVLNKEDTLESKSGLFYTFDNLGEAYRTQGKILKAEEYYLKALEIAKEIKKKDGRAWSNLHLGIVAWAKGDLQKAKNFLILSRMIWKNLSIRDHAYVETIATLAGVYTDLKEYKKATRTLDEAQTITDEIKSDYTQLFVNYFRGYLKQQQNDATSAKKYFKRCLTKAKEQKNAEYIIKSLVALSHSALSDYNNTLQENYLMITQDLLKSLEETVREKKLAFHLDEVLIIQGMLLSTTMNYQESQKVLTNALKLAKEQDLPAQVDKAQEEIKKVRKLEEQPNKSIRTRPKKKEVEEIIKYLKKYKQTLRALTT